MLKKYALIGVLMIAAVLALSGFSYWGYQPAGSNGNTSANYSANLPLGPRADSSSLYWGYQPVGANYVNTALYWGYQPAGAGGVNSAIYSAFQPVDFNASSFGLYWGYQPVGSY
jgi:hypothetical protein